MNQLQICIINKKYNIQIKLVYPQANQEEFQNQDKNKNVKYPREEIEELEDEPEFDGKYQKCLFKCGECLKCFGTYCPYNIIVGKTFRQIQQGFAGVLLRFGKYYKTTSAGILQLNPCTDTLFIVDCRTQLLNYENQSVITKDNIQIEGYRAKKNDFQYIWFLNKQFLDQPKHLLSERNEIQILIKEFVETHSTDWGIEIEAIMINNIQMDQQTQNTLAQVATETRAAQVKILMAQSNVQSAKMMKEAAEMLNSRAAMQIRYLEIVGNVGNEAQTKVVIM